MKLNCLSVMDIGPREIQQDCILAGSDIFQDKKVEAISIIDTEENPVIAVCDGVGSDPVSHEISKFVCERLKAKVPKDDLSKDDFRAVLNEIQSESVSQFPKTSGTTIAGMVFTRKKILIFNAGDSRVYVISNKKLVYASQDHSYVQSLSDKGLINDEEAFKHPYRNVILFGVGTLFTKQKKQDFNIFEAKLDVSGCYLICTDGVSDVLKEKDIFKTLGNLPVTNGSKLLDKIKKTGLKDNTSFIILSPFS